MAYISTSHNVGDAVFRYDMDTDAVWRGTVTAIKAICRSGTRYSAEFDVSYEVEFADGPCEHNANELYDSALSAFNSAAEKVQPAPIPVPEVSMVPMPESAAAGDTF